MNIQDGIYVVNDDGDLIEDGQFIHQWDEKKIFFELQRNLKSDKNTSLLKKEMLKKLFKKFLLIDQNSKKTESSIATPIVEKPGTEEEEEPD